MKKSPEALRQIILHFEDKLLLLLLFFFFQSYFFIFALEFIYLF